MPAGLTAGSIPFAGRAFFCPAGREAEELRDSKRRPRIQDLPRAGLAREFDGEERGDRRTCRRAPPNCRPPQRAGFFPALHALQDAPRAGRAAGAAEGGAGAGRRSARALLRRSCGAEWGGGYITDRPSDGSVREEKTMTSGGSSDSDELFLPRRWLLLCVEANGKVGRLLRTSLRGGVQGLSTR